MQLQSKFFDHQVYRSTHTSQTRIGFTFKPTPNLSRDELHELISDLLMVADSVAPKER